MIFTPTPLPGAYVVEVERREDERGFFARTYCRQELERHGLNADVAQCNVSHNLHKATLRGLHYQAAPHQEAKLVRCIRGEIYDVIVDLRPSSTTYRQWFGVTLSARQHNALYVPPDFAHGFCTLVDDTEVLYQMSQFYYPESARGLRWDDPELCIPWPVSPEHISDRDRSYALLQEHR
jgi:dTDP-4-dehydrorhamnose 3,5-epimerase